MSHLTEAKKLSKNLKRLIQEADRLDTSKILSGSGKGAVERAYEFYVDFRALHDLLADWDLTLVNHRGKRNVRFPHGPAQKANFPYFEASDSGGIRFQICLGTEIMGPNGSSFTPDLSIQDSGASLNPSSSDFLFGWDQKYTSATRLNRDETAKVSALLTIVPPLARISVDPFTGRNWPNSCSIVTNSNHSTVTDSDLQVWKLSEVYNCSPGRNMQSRP